MRGRFWKLLLVALLLQISTAAAYAVTGVDACSRPDGVGDAEVASAEVSEEEQVGDGGPTIVVSMPEAAGDAVDAIMSDLDSSDEDDSE